MLSCFFFFKKKKFAKGLDRTVLTGSCGPTPVLTVHRINKKFGSLGLKNWFSSRFSVFTVRPPGPVRFWKLPGSAYVKISSSRTWKQQCYRHSKFHNFFHNLLRWHFNLQCITLAWITILSLLLHTNHNS